MFKKINYIQLPTFNYGYYKAVYLPNHQDADSRGNVYLHRLIAEQEILNRPIKKDEVVHHIDENKNNNSPDNLLVFKSQNDHTAFHQGGQLIKDGDVYISSRKIYYCKYCGCQVSYGNNQCAKCYKKIHQISNKPTKEILEDELKNKTYSAIAREYNVTPNSVKKWAKGYGIYERVFLNPPDEFYHDNFLLTHTLNEVARKYGVSTRTITTWSKNTNIPIMKKRIRCIDNDKIYSSGRAVVREFFPEDKEQKHNSEKLTKAIKGGKSIWGHNWEFVYIPTYYN